MRRTIVCLALLFVALGAAFLATRARRLGLRVESFAVAPGGDVDNAPKLGDDLPFAPQRFAFVENVLGDDRSLADAMDKVAQFGGADVVVLLGNVLGSGADGEARRLLAACRDRGADVLAVPGPRDLAPSRGEVFATWFGPERWWFVRRGCLYVGVPGRGADDDEFCRAALAAAPSGSRPFVFTAGRVGVSLPKGALFAPRQADPSVAGVTVHIVGADAESGGEMGAAWGSRMFGASPWRFLALDVLFPLVRSTSGYVAFLCACAVVAAFALTRLRRPEPERVDSAIAPRDRSVR